MARVRGEYRGKRNYEHEWLYGYYVEEAEECGYIVEGSKFAGISFAEVDPDTVSRSIHKSDRSGKEIFENDIVETPVGHGVIGIGTYSVDGNVQLGVYIDFIDKVKTRYVRRDFNYWWLEGMKIVGNIYDNPELLKGE